MKARYFVFLMVVISASSSASDTAGNNSFDGSVLNAYDLEWLQCRYDGESWRSGPNLREALVPMGELLLIRQNSVRPDGLMNQLEVTLSKNTMMPSSSKVEISTPDGNPAYVAVHHIGTDGYNGYVTRGGETKQVSGSINNQMLHGGTMGLPLASLRRVDGQVSFDASMLQFDGTYKVVAKWVGSETLLVNDQSVTVQWVDVSWLHNESGDIYKMGPNESGGRYWLINEPAEGMPYVLRYQTDTYAIEFVKDRCP